MSTDYRLPSDVTRCQRAWRLCRPARTLSLIRTRYTICCVRGVTVFFSLKRCQDFFARKKGIFISFKTISYKILMTNYAVAETDFFAYAATLAAQHMVFLRCSHTNYSRPTVFPPSAHRFFLEISRSSPPTQELFLTRHVFCSAVSFTNPA